MKHISFAPRLLPAPDAAAYIGVSATKLRALPIPRKVLDGKRFTLGNQCVIIKRPAGCLQHRNGPNRNGSDKDHVMATSRLPSPEELRQLLDYDAETGVFLWRHRTSKWFSGGAHSSEQECKRWNSRHAGKLAMTSANRGYLRGRVMWKIIEAHRAAWCISYGYWPHVIDHINHNRSDNRLVNLREVTQADNAKNTSLYSRNKSGVSGVYWVEKTRRWISTISINGKQKHIGVYASFEDACHARRQAEQENSYHINHGLNP